MRFALDEGIGFLLYIVFAKWYLVHAKRHSLPNHVLFLGLTLSDCVGLGTSSVRLCEVINISAILSQMWITDSSVWEALFVTASSKILRNSWILFLSRLFSKLSACFGFHFGFPKLRLCLRYGWHLCDFGHLQQRSVAITIWSSENNRVKFSNWKIVNELKKPVGDNWIIYSRTITKR